MTAAIAERRAKSVLSRSGIPGIDYCVNPYIGCAHGCVYCYASFMRRFTGHAEPWGEFVDAKVNAPELLARELRRAAPGRVLLSSVTDPYQGAEARFGLTRGCLEAIAADGRFGVEILTRSPLVVRDLGLLSGITGIEVGLSVTTDSEAVRRAFEPNAPAIAGRVEALARLHQAGIATYAFIGPVLPMNPEKLAALLAPHVDAVLVDRMNYPWKSRGVYRRLDRSRWLEPAVADEAIDRLEEGFAGIPVTRC